MIFFSFGLPSAFADWCELILTELARRAFGAVEFVNANTLEDLGAAFVRTNTSHMVFCSRLPSARLCKLLKETNSPFLFVLDDARATIAYLTAIRGWDFLPTVKLVASSYATSTRYADYPNALRLKFSRDRADVPKIVKDINNHFGFSTSQRDIAAISEAVRQQYEHPTRTEVSSWWNALDESQQRVINGAIDGYSALANTGRFGPLTWARELFLAADTLKPLTRPIDLTGRSRLLIFGPYINLPCGSWTAHVVFGCSSEAVGANLIVDAFSKSPLAQVQMQLKKAGIFTVPLKFVVDGSAENEIEIRVLSEKPALDGMVSLSHVTLICDSDPEPRNPKLSNELGLEVS